MDLQGDHAHLLLNLRFDASGADLLGGTGLVLIGIIIEIDLGNDLHRGKCLTAECAAGKLTAVNILLCHKGISEGEAFADRICQILLAMHDIYAYG